MHIETELEPELQVLADLERKLNGLDMTETRELFESGLADLDCRVRTYASKPGKKEVKILFARINPERAAKRALAYCGTNNPRLV